MANGNGSNFVSRLLLALFIVALVMFLAAFIALCAKAIGWALGGLF
ncbi:MAG: hypothetical protein IJ131_09750 [Eggerthellaceae bacterium]|nr:hypothetical protein [Eggerthellaceae bacterium]